MYMEKEKEEKYIGRIFMEVKNRPLYFVDEYSNSKVMEKVYEVET